MTNLEGRWIRTDGRTWFRQVPRDSGRSRSDTTDVRRHGGTELQLSVPVRRALSPGRRSHGGHPPARYPQMDRTWRRIGRQGSHAPSSAIAVVADGLSVLSWLFALVYITPDGIVERLARPNPSSSSCCSAARCRESSEASSPPWAGFLDDEDTGVLSAELIIPPAIIGGTCLVVVW